MIEPFYNYNTRKVRGQLCDNDFIIDYVSTHTSITVLNRPLKVPEYSQRGFKYQYTGLVPL